ncbi:hypothetical protein QYH69_07810 [Paraburkholderia sp. SARCC-3016]|uniref:hypothetical protein n=1 Tax=Paraburkholderia sp. SARCC-3016 TaxID=3058611 RepID=UPI0028076B57|nr:hypothetical protein [Paraburkholderia sp. SARCC-3016]MDQ7977151.1 hypothetical protein [Paraburkholderia sp. SARCC-3016]
MSIETNTSAVAIFYQLVRQYALTTPAWAVTQSYQTKPDERWDLTLASRRAYGIPDEFLTIMAAAGLDSVEQELPEQLLILPDAATLKSFKTQAKFVNLADDRDPTPANFIPPEYVALVTRQTIPPTT